MLPLETRCSLLVPETLWHTVSDSHIRDFPRFQLRFKNPGRIRPLPGEAPERRLFGRDWGQKQDILFGGLFARREPPSDRNSKPFFPGS